MTHRHPMPGTRCRMIGCDFETPDYSDLKVRARALGEHQAQAHGIGRIKGNEAHLGCFFAGCTFRISGSAKFTEQALRDHLITAHQVDPENPEIPAEARRGEW